MNNVIRKHRIYNNIYETLLLGAWKNKFPTGGSVPSTFLPALHITTPALHVVTGHTVYDNNIIIYVIITMYVTAAECPVYTDRGYNLHRVGGTAATTVGVTSCSGHRP